MAEDLLKNRKMLLSSKINKVNNQQYLHLNKSFLKTYSMKNSNFVLDDCFGCNTLLDNIVFDGQNFLLFSDIADRNVYLLNLLNQNVSRIPVSEEFQFTSFNSILFQNDTYLVLQEKYKIDIIKFQNIHEYKKISSWVFKDSIIDAKLNKYEQAALHLGFTKTNCKLLIKNVATDSTIFKYKNENIKHVDNFLCFQFNNTNCLLLMNRSSVKLINYMESDILNVFTPELMICNSLNVMKTINELSFMVASSHLFYEVDIRNLKHDCFPHGLLNKPTLLDVYSQDTNIYLAIASKVIDDIAVFKGNPVFNKIPLIIPKVKTFYKKKILNNSKMLLTPYFDKQCRQSNYGIKIVEMDGNLSLFWYNSLGCLYGQQLSSTKNEPYEVNLNRNEFECNYSCNSQDKLLVTNIADLSSAKFDLNKTCTDNGLLKLYSVNTKKMLFLNKQMGIYSRKSTTNELSKNFNLIWETNKSECVTEDGQQLPIIHSNEKVRRWIHSMNFENEVDKID